MAGYYKKSMSNNAIDAYCSGEMPKSKWTKNDILFEIKSFYSDEDFEKLQSMRFDSLEYWFLQRTCWHHTGNHYRRTMFYRVVIPSVDVDTMLKDDSVRRDKEEGITQEEFDEYITHRNVRYVKFVNEEYNYGSYSRYEGKGIIAGKYCYIVEYMGREKISVKRIDGMHFFYEEKDIHFNRPKDFDPVKTKVIMKEYNLGRFYPKPKGITINPKDYMFSLKDLQIRNDLDVKAILELLVEESLHDRKLRKTVKKAILYAADASDFVKNLMSDDDFKTTNYYYDLLALELPSGSEFYSIIESKRWYTIRSLFGLRRLYADPDSYFVYYGTDDNVKMADCNCGSNRIRIAVFDDLEENKSIKPKIEKLMDYITSESGEFCVFDSADLLVLEKLNGQYSIYKYKGLVAFVKDNEEIENAAA